MEPDPRREPAPGLKLWTRRCPRCGKELPSKQRFCPADGTALSESEPQEATVIGRAPSEDDGDEQRPGPREPAGQRDPLIGTRLGEYVVRRRIGSGGMGIVYEAEQPQIRRKVAVKVLRPDVESGLITNLVGEARASGRIRHRTIVDVFGFGEIPSVGQYIVMEYLEGRSLDQLLAERETFTVPEVLWLVDEVLSGLAAAHAEGVIHRDLKPSNLFVVSASGGAQYLKILDFGLAKQTGLREPGAPSSRSDLLVGTPEYMAPEMAQGRPVSGRTDLYSLGVIAFEMLTGLRPFDGATFLQMAIAQVWQPPPHPSELAPVPAELDALVLQLLEKDPARRPANAAAVRREVKQLAQRLGVVTRIGKNPEPDTSPAAEPTRVYRGSATAKPRVSVAAMMAALAVVGVAGGVIWTRARAPAQDPPASIASESSKRPAPPESRSPTHPSTAAPEPIPQLASAHGDAPAHQDGSARGAAPTARTTPETPSSAASTAPGTSPAKVPNLTVTARETPPHSAPVLAKEAPRAPPEPTQEELLQRIDSLRRRVEASAPPGENPNPMMLTLLGRQDAAARAAPDGPARAKVARSLDAFERQFEKSGDLGPR